MPCHPVNDFVQVLLDNVWAQVLHVAYVQHLQFGRDIVFSYGPWGFLARGYIPPTYAVSTLAWLALSLVFISAGWRVARYFTDNHVISWLWLVGFTALASLPAGNDVGDRLMAWCVLLLFLHFCVEERAFTALQALLTFTLGWLGLVKFTGFMEGGLLVAVIAMDNIIRQRRFPWIIAVWLAGIIFFWLLAGQQPGWLWPFLKSSWEVTNGYSGAMNFGDLLVLNPLIYAVIAAGFCGLGLILARPAGRAGAVFFALGMGGLLFLSFKQGYVRNDPYHEIDAGLALMMVGMACAGVAAKQKKAAVVMAAVWFCVATAFALFMVKYPSSSGNLWRQLAQTLSPYNLFCPVVNLATPALEEDYKTAQKQLREELTLSAAHGGADLYPFRQDILFANGMDYQPRPVIQSYSAYTPALARMNADWLRTDRAATNLFFMIEPIDERFPSLDDGLSWPEILTRYDIQGFSDRKSTYLHLLRSPAPRAYHLQPLQETNVTLGKPFALPAATNGLIWAEINIQETPAGKLLAFFYKPTILLADVKLADHSEKFRRLVPGMMSAGFLLSPYIAEAKSFLSLAGGDSAGLSGKAVVSITFLEMTEPGLPLCYQPDIKIRFYCLDFPAQDIKHQVFPNDLEHRQPN